MNILLVNVDSTIPNLALEKLRVFHESAGDLVRQIKDCQGSGLPNPLFIDTYDKIYVSCIFLWNKERCKRWEGLAAIGGSGYSLEVTLPPEVEIIKPKINYGFITRGCIRNCLDGDTLIQTVFGDVPLRKLVGKKVGVWTYDSKTGKTFVAEATNIWKTGVKDCVRVVFDEGSSIVCTPDHKFKNENQHEEGKEAKDLKCGDRILALQDGQSRISKGVVSVEFVGKREVFDMSVPETNWFFANNVLVHNCPWCIVPKKEGKVHQVGTIYDIWDGKHNSLTIMDNNILAMPEVFFETTAALKKEGLRVDFNQGLDHRLLTDEICKELFSLRYKPELGCKIRFAYDHISYRNSVLRALNLLKKHGMREWQTRWYVYVGTYDTYDTVMERVNLLREWKQAVFLMRDRDPIVMKNQTFQKIYVWCSCVNLFAKMTFDEFMKSGIWANRPKSLLFSL